MPSLSCSGDRGPPGSSPRLIAVLFALSSECAVHLAAAASWLLRGAGCWFSDGRQSLLHAWVALSAAPPPRSSGTSHQVTYKHNEAEEEAFLTFGKKRHENAQTRCGAWRFFALISDRSGRFYQVPTAG